MIEVKIPSDIQAYKSKLIAGLSTRQVIAIIGAIVVGVPVGVFGRAYIPSDILPWIVILLVVPIIGWGFFTFKDMRFEEFMKQFISMNFLPQERVYEDTDMNLFLQLRAEVLEQDLITQHIAAGDYIETDETEGVS